MPVAIPDKSKPALENARLLHNIGSVGQDQRIVRGCDTPNPLCEDDIFRDQVGIISPPVDGF